MAFFYIVGIKPVLQSYSGQPHKFHTKNDVRQAWAILELSPTSLLLNLFIAAEFVSENHVEEQENGEEAVKDVEKLQAGATVLLFALILVFLNILVHHLQPDKEHKAQEESDGAEVCLAFGQA